MPRNASQLSYHWEKALTLSWVSKRKHLWWYFISLCMSKSWVFNQWPAGQIRAAEQCHPAHRAPPKNLATGQQWQLTAIFLLLNFQKRGSPEGWIAQPGVQHMGPIGAVWGWARQGGPEESRSRWWGREVSQVAQGLILGHKAWSNLQMCPFATYPAHEAKIFSTTGVNGSCLAT